MFRLQTLGIGTAPQGTIGYNIGSAVAKVLAEKASLRRACALLGSSAVSPSPHGVRSPRGTPGNAGGGERKGRPDNRRADTTAGGGVAFPLNLGFLVKKDPKKNQPRDTAQVTLKRVVDAILANGGIDASYVRTALVPNVVRGADDFIEGKADAAFFAIGAGKVAEADKSVGGIRFLALSDDPKAVAAMKEIYPYAYVNEVRPRPNLAGIGVPTKLMAYDYLIVSGAHVKDDVVYRITRALNAHKDKLVASLAAFGDFNPATMHKPVPAPFHPGSLKYYAEKGMVRK